MYYIKQNETIKIDDGLDNIAMLAPCMYWFVKKSFPFDAKRKIEKIILKSAKNSVEFVESVFCYKQEELYVCFAYDLAGLKKRFLKEGLAMDKIYFISSFYAPQRDIRISPSVMLSALAETYFESSQKSSREILLQELSLEGVECVSFAQNDYLGWHMASLALLGVGFLLSVIAWSVEGNRLSQLESTLGRDNYTMDALIRKYESTEQEQLAFRNALVALPQMSKVQCKGALCENK